MPQSANTPPLPTPPALNHLLADSDHVQHIGDTTVVCWAEGADDAYPGFFSAVIGGGTYGGLSDNDLRAALKRLANGCRATTSSSIRIDRFTFSVSRPTRRGFPSASSCATASAR